MLMNSAASRRGASSIRASFRINSDSRTTSSLYNTRYYPSIIRTTTAVAPVAVAAAATPVATRSASTSTASSHVEKIASNSSGKGGAHNAKSNMSFGLPSIFGLSAVSLSTGYILGQVKSQQYHDHIHNHDHDHFHDDNCTHEHDTHDKNSKKTKQVLPSGIQRSCCSCESTNSSESTPPSLNLTTQQSNLPSILSKIVGSENIQSGLHINSSNTMYLKGARLGKGAALAIVSPTTLQEAVDCLEQIVNADCVVIPQGANTGLTGGSVPRNKDNGNDVQRPTVIISMKNLDTMFPIDDGTKVVCLAGSGISSLSQALPQWGFEDRESHSILGSTFLNPTTAAGVAFGSGGTQLRKGPAYTDRCLYAKVHKDKWGKHVVQIINTLGIAGLEDDDFYNNSGTVIEQLDIYANDVKEGYTRAMAKSSNSTNGKAMASDTNYATSVCQVGDDEDGRGVSRYNADTKGEDCNRSEGKVLILATVHDTFAKPKETKYYWISFRTFEAALAFRKEVCLDNPQDLPITVEYMDRDSFDVIDGAGRFMGNLIKMAGMGSIVTMLWSIKLQIEAMPVDGSELFCDKIMYYLNDLTPAILPSRIMESGKALDHHISITVGDFDDGEMDRFNQRLAAFQQKQQHGDDMIIHECETQAEKDSLTAFRFVAAPAFRTWCVGNNVQGFSVDYALPKNGGFAPALDGEESAADSSSTNAEAPIKRMRYSHFGCNVVHEDLAYNLGVDVHAAKMNLKKQVELDGGKLPAEHGHGTEYKAPVDTQNRWKKMDPTNVMNPGIGGLKYGRNYSD